MRSIRPFFKLYRLPTEEAVPTAEATRDAAAAAGKPGVAARAEAWRARAAAVRDHQDARASQEDSRPELKAPRGRAIKAFTEFARQVTEDADDAKSPFHELAVEAESRAVVPGAEHHLARASRMWEIADTAVGVVDEPAFAPWLQGQYRFANAVTELREATAALRAVLGGDPALPFTLPEDLAVLDELHAELFCHAIAATSGDEAAREAVVGPMIAANQRRGAYLKARSPNPGPVRTASLPET